MEEQVKAANENEQNGTAVHSVPVLQLLKTLKFTILSWLKIRYEDEYIVMSI